MYLWQIRHIPNDRQTFLSLTSWLVLAVGMLCLSGWLVRPASGQGDDNVPTGEKAASAAKPSAVEGSKAATAFVARVHEELRKHASVKAEIEQVVSMGSQQFRVTGLYASSGSKLRLEYKVKPDQGFEGSLLEVCDGKELWSLMLLPGSKRVTHRDVQQIKAAALANKTMPDAVLSAELGLGGLTALLASLERTMTFDAVRQEEVDGRSRTVVQGRWKDTIVSRWKRKPDDPLPAYIPEQIRLFVDTKTLFPERIVYLKEHVEPATKDKKESKVKKSQRALVSLQFQNVQFDTPIDESEFTFVPPEDVVPEDITRQYLDRMQKGQESQAAPVPGTPAPRGVKPASAPTK